jgi:hypothetical protein
MNVSLFLSDNVIVVFRDSKQLSEFVSGTCHHDGSPPAPDKVRGKAPDSGHIAASGRQNLIAVHQGG